MMTFNDFIKKFNLRNKATSNIKIQRVVFSIGLNEVRKIGNKLKLEDNEYKLSDFDTQKNEIFEELKNVKYNDLDDMVYRFQLTYKEIVDILDLKYIPTKRTNFSLNPGIYGVVDLNNTLKHILPDNVKVIVTIDDVR